MNFVYYLENLCVETEGSPLFRVQSYKENGKLKLGISNYSRSPPIF
jgi:hypothetical protein